jgi:hypothetical protein
MTPEQFAYWLHGFCELNGNAAPTPAQWKAISAHLDTVFKKVTPPVVPVAPTQIDNKITLDPSKWTTGAWPPAQPFQWGPLGYPPGTIIC